MTAVLGLGAWVPERVMTNDDWAALVDTSDEWIVQRTGIRERRIMDDGDSTADLAERAARAAIDDADLTADDIDEIIVATDTPEVYTPDTASFLQHRLGCREIPTYDLGGSGCAGFVQAVDVARARIALDGRTVLVIGVEAITRILSWTDRDTIVLFGDGAGAMVLGPEGGIARVLDASSGTDGSMAGILTVEVGGSRRPFDPNAEGEPHRHLEMHGREVFKHAVHRMASVSQALLDRLDLTIDDVDLVIPHQANKRIIDAVGRKLAIDEDRVYVNVDRYGNTGSASVPIALAEAWQERRIQPGALVLLTAFGAGFHWSAAALRF